MGSLSNYPATEGSGGASAWAPGAGDSPYMPSRRDHMQGYGGSKGLRLDREEYDPSRFRPFPIMFETHMLLAMLQYGQTPSLPHPRQFTPDTPSHSHHNSHSHSHSHRVPPSLHEENYHPHYGHHPSQHTPQQQAQAHAFGGGGDGRGFQGYHQQRTQSPTPLGSHGE
jgi:hypothetical protein